MGSVLERYREIWMVDFEFSQTAGERPEPICMVAREYFTKKLLLRFSERLRSRKPPFPKGSDVLFVAYFASAEFSCFLALDWPVPKRILDLYAEFRCLTSGRTVPNGSGLLGALTYFGLDAIESAEKNSMRELAIRGGPYTKREEEALLAYCQSDVDALARLLPAMTPYIDLPRALLRGRYTVAVAQMERSGVPIDVSTFATIKKHWPDLQDSLISRLDEARIWDGRSFRQENFARFLRNEGIPWPRLPSGALALDDRTFRTMSKVHPQLWPIRELRHALSNMRLNALTVGQDGRNRCLLSPFGSRTGRNTPSNTRFIFGPAVWLRYLIRPTKGRALAYIDWSQQEFGIAAALSGDQAMCHAYLSGDPYLAFAKQAGAVPENASKKTHPKERDRFKVCALGVQYGMGERSLATSLNESQAAARELLLLHRRTYRDFWRWSESAVNYAMLKGYLHTVFGWRVHVGPNANPRSLANFPMQANGAEMLRLACCLGTEAGIRICAPVHDAVLIEAEIDRIDETVALMQKFMKEASEVVLSGFPLRSDVEIFRYPERYQDPRGTKMWNVVMEILNEPKTTLLSNRSAVLETGGSCSVSVPPAQSYVL